MWRSASVAFYINLPRRWRASAVTTMRRKVASPRSLSPGCEPRDWQSVQSPFKKSNSPLRRTSLFSMSSAARAEEGRLPSVASAAKGSMSSRKLRSCELVVAQCPAPNPSTAWRKWPAAVFQPRSSSSSSRPERCSGTATAGTTEVKRADSMSYSHPSAASASPEWFPPNDAGGRTGRGRGPRLEG
jgi:hypothetical protein